MPLYLGTTGTCHWTHIVGPIDEGEFARLVERMRLLGEVGRPNEVVLTVLFDAPMPSVTRRRALSETVRDAQDRGGYLFAGHAMVTSNSVTRGLMTALNWVIKPKYDERVFKHPNAGVSWLKTRCPTFDCKRTLAAIADVNPEFPSLQW